MSPLLVGAALGATSAFILDPQQGRRRRALVRDKVTRGMRESREFAVAARKDLSQRAHGAVGRARQLRGGTAPDHVLAERVRAKLGRYSSHPGAIDVAVADGCVLLTGNILSRELEPLVHALRSLPGVEQVENKLVAHPGADGIPSLQGGREKHGEPWEVFEDMWTPGVRALVGGAAAASILYAYVRGGFRALVPLTLGVALLACSINASGRRSARSDS